MLQDLGIKYRLASRTMITGSIELLAGDAAEAVRQLHAGYESLAAMGERAFLSTVAGFLASALYAQGRDEEAQRFTEIAEEAAYEHDLSSQIRWRMTRAKVLARRGELEPAEPLAREAVALASQTDALNLHAAARHDLAEVLLAAGRPNDAATELREALALYEQKWNIVSARGVRARLEALGGNVAAGR